MRRTGQRRVGLTWIAASAVAVLLLWWCWPQDALAPPTAAPSSHPAAASPATAIGDGELSSQRQEVRPPAVVPAGRQQSEVATWSVRILVLDDRDVPIEAATVEVWAGETQQRVVADGRGERSVWLGRAEGPPLLTAVTAADGSCELHVARQRVYASARHPAFGQSVVHAIDRDLLPDDRVVKMWLARPVLVRGLVIDADGRPAPFARVDVQVAVQDYPRPRACCLSSGEVVADGCGRFRFEANAGTPMRLQAEPGSESLPLTLTATAGLEVVLPLAGAISVDGRVIDHAGVPVAHASLRFSPVDPLYFGVTRKLWVESRTDGSFRLALPTHAAFKVWAQAGCLRTAAVMVQPTPLLPHPQIELQLPRPAPIRGHVFLVDGSPASGAEVTAEPCGSGGSRESQLWTHADASGAFRLQTTAQTNWDLHATAAGEEAAAERHDVAAGSEDVRIVLQAPVGQGLRGRVVVAASGQVLPQYLLAWARCRDTVLREYRPVPRFTIGIDGSFTMATIPPGEDWVLMATAEGLGGAVAGPFPPSRPGAFVQMSLPALGELPVRLMGAGGQPLRNLTVSALLSDLMVLSMMAQPRSTTSDANGCCRLHLMPGRATVVVRRSFEELARREVHVVSGANGELIVQVQL